jgi:hypothetical protein
MRLNMRTNLKVILSAVTLVVLLASPAMARHYYPYGGYGYYRGYGGYYGYGRSYGPYTPSLPTLPYGRSRDFQTGSRG